MTTTTNSRSGEKGFTLVELSIVMIIIGLLIGGILKGQELIANARLASAVSKVKAIDAALNTFRDSYAGLPGDLISTRLPNCAPGTKCAAGDALSTLGNNLIGAVNFTGQGQVQNSENINAWAQLAATDLLGGIRNDTAAALISGGSTVPQAEIPGQIYIGNENGSTAPTGYAGVATSARGGHYLLIHNGVQGSAGTSTTASATTTASLTPGQVSRIDSKLDDGTPNSGAVLAMGTAGAGVANCTLGPAVTDAYNLATSGNVCGVYIRIQQ